MHPLAEDMEHSDPVLKGMVTPLEDLGLLHPLLVNMVPYFVACFLIHEALGMEVVPDLNSLKENYKKYFKLANTCQCSINIIQTSLVGSDISIRNKGLPT